MAGHTHLSRAGFEKQGESNPSGDANFVYQSISPIEKTLPIQTTKDKGKEERDVVLLGSICKNKIYVISFSVVLGPQALPEKLKAHFAGPSLSFYVKVWCVYSEVQPEALVSHTKHPEAGGNGSLGSFFSTFPTEK